MQKESKRADKGETDIRAQEFTAHTDSQIVLLSQTETSEIEKTSLCFCTFETIVRFWP